MNNKLLAVKRTAYMLAVCTAASLAVFALFSLVTAKQALLAFGVGALVFCLYMMYSINLGRIEYEQAVKQREQDRARQ